MELRQDTHAGGGARALLPAQDISTEGMLGLAAEPRSSTTVSFDRDTRTVGNRFSVVVDAFASALGAPILRDRSVSRVPSARDLGKTHLGSCMTGERAERTAACRPDAPPSRLQLHTAPRGTQVAPVTVQS
jgi:hypothetical protein